VRQVNAVPGRPAQSPEEVRLTLKTLQWTILPDGKTQKRKRWKITNSRDAHARAFAFKLLMGFLATLERQRAWYPDVYNRPELYSCAKCHQPDETQEHIYECADHSEVEECFRAKFRALQPRGTALMDTRPLGPWNSLGRLQGRIHPRWEPEIMAIQGDEARTAATTATIQQLLRASTETWYEAIWLPRCQRTTEQERSQGLYQGAKLRRMRAPTRDRANAPPSPTPNLPPSFLDSMTDRREAYHSFLFQLMHGTGRRLTSE
jgi:hypothetical protein